MHVGANFFVSGCNLSCSRQVGRYFFDCFSNKLVSTSMGFPHAVLSL